MAIAVSPTNNARDHYVMTVAIGATTTWQSITFPTWTQGVEIVNYGTDILYISTDVDDGDAGSGGVEIPSGQSYRFKADYPYLCVRHAAGSYTFGLVLTNPGGA